MSRLLRAAFEVIQLVSLLLFCVLLLFWFIVAVKTMSNLAEGGVAEAQRWLYRIMLKSDEIIPPIPRYGTVVAVRFGELAAVTAALGLVSRKMINKIIKYLRNRPPAHV
ncbi:hypothetical protein DYQ86_12505 [Acidobacteria bacterium AB60]|nr:hypothetical protein DYQ86_12505 [Acidobacteria bacterium AB60]